MVNLWDGQQSGKENDSRGDVFQVIWVKLHFVWNDYLSVAIQGNDND